MLGHLVSQSSPSGRACHLDTRSGVVGLALPSNTETRRCSRSRTVRVAAIAPPLERQAMAPSPVEEFEDRTRKGLSEKPPFGLADIKNAIPAHCLKKDAWRSMSYLFKDVAIVVGLAVAAYTIDQWWLWPAYVFAQSTMFWALFVVGHDCGHGSFSNNKTLNDLVGNITHASILVPYHGWRISHRTHHQNHGHVENDESWHPVPKHLYDGMDKTSRLGRLTFPTALFAYPFYLWFRSPGKQGSHYDPKCDLFQPHEGKMIETSNKFMLGMIAVLAACTVALGPKAMFLLYVLPYWGGVVWLDIVTYLHHHGTDNPDEHVPWYRGEEWSYLRGGLSTLDRDYGIFNNIHHDIGTHVLHHLFPQVPHYHLTEATEAVKPVLGKYYREPQPSKSWFPSHLFEPLVRSFKNDHYVESTGDVVFYKTDPDFHKAKPKN